MVRGKFLQGLFLRGAAGERVNTRAYQARGGLEGNLAHKKPPPPKDYHRTLDIVHLKGPNGGVVSYK